MENDWIGIPENINDYEGFCYRISHKNSGFYYIGKKSFWASARKKLVRKPTKTEKTRLDKYKKDKNVKYQDYKLALKEKYAGKKKVVKGRKESDWENYWGSSERFKDYVAEEGTHMFTRKIIRLCLSKSELSYQELLSQIEHDVLNDDMAFNGMINVRLYKTK